MTWNTIDSAPKDGSQFDVCRFACGEWERATDVKWDHKRSCFIAWGMGDFDRMGWVRIGFDPSHWTRVEFPSNPRSEA